MRPNATIIQRLYSDLRGQLTVFAIVLYLHLESLTWDQRKPLCSFQSRVYSSE
jgi:hypothetical protein